MVAMMSLAKLTFKRYDNFDKVNTRVKNRESLRVPRSENSLWISLRDVQSVKKKDICLPGKIGLILKRSSRT